CALRALYASPTRRSSDLSHLLHAGCGLLERCGLLLRTLRQIVVAERELPRRRADRIRAGAHAADDLDQLRVHPLQGIEQLPELVVRFHTHFVAQFTAGDAIGDVYRRIEGTHDRTDQEEEDRRGDTDAKDDRADDEPTITRVGTLRFVAHLLS